jgi:hypothetical protein
MKNDQFKVIVVVFYLIAAVAWVSPIHAGGGPLGIDHRLSYDDHGF